MGVYFLGFLASAALLYFVGQTWLTAIAIGLIVTALVVRQHIFMKNFPGAFVKAFTHEQEKRQREKAARAAAGSVEVQP